MSADRWPLELVSRPLEASEVVAQFERATELARALGAERVELSFGWGCDESIVWQSREVGLGEIATEIDCALSAGSYRPGEAEVVLADADGSFEFRFCEASDVHFECSERRVLDLVERAFEAFGLDPKILRGE